MTTWWQNVTREGSAQSLRDQVAGYRFIGNPEMRLNGPSPLRHPVHFGLLEFEPLFQGRVIDDKGYRENSLPPDPG